jgi:site-specific DNA recombinase
VRQTLNLAFLSPEVVKAAVEGTLPDGAGLMSLCELPPLWSAHGGALQS